MCWAAPGVHLGLNEKHTLNVTSLGAVPWSTSRSSDLPGKPKLFDMYETCIHPPAQCTDLLYVHLVLCPFMKRLRTLIKKNHTIVLLSEQACLTCFVIDCSREGAER